MGVANRWGQALCNDQTREVFWQYIQGWCVCGGDGGGGGEGLRRYSVDIGVSKGLLQIDKMLMAISSSH